MEIGPSRRRSSSSPVKRPAKLKPSPLSSTTRVSRLSSCDSFTTTWEAFACFFMLLSASRYIWKISRQTRSGACSSAESSSKIQRQRRFVPEAARSAREAPHQVHHVLLADCTRSGRRSVTRLPQLRALILHRLLQPSQPRFHLLHVRRNLCAAARQSEFFNAYKAASAESRRANPAKSATSPPSIAFRPAGAAA